MEAKLSVVIYTLIGLLLYTAQVLWAQEIKPGETARQHERTWNNMDSRDIKIVPSQSALPNHILSKAALKEHLLLAIGSDDIPEVERFISAGADVNRPITENGMTPLMLCRSPGMVSTLLEKGANPDRRDDKGMTALHYHLFSDSAEKILPLLLNAGADVNAVAIGSNKETPLLAARQLFFEGGDPNRGERIIRLLSQAGAFLDAQDELGYTVLMTAVVNNKPRLAQLILSLGADPHVQTEEGKTALDWARELGRDKLERMLLQYKAD